MYKIVQRVSASGFTILMLISFYSKAVDIDELRAVYSQPSELWPAAEIDENVQVREIGLLGEVTFPKDNPFTIEKLTLGEMLFHDGRLSRSEQTACASCHEPELGWSDGRKTSFGHNRQRGKRNAPIIENVAFGEHFFWDGRAETLEQQALMPIQDPVEMNFTLPELVARLKTIPEYQAAFKRAFDDGIINSNNIALALATYQRTIKSRRSEFDRFLLASKQSSAHRKQIYLAAMSDKAILGLHLFRTKARCMNCHNGPTFSDNKFHNIGLTYYKRKLQDLGRYMYTGKVEDVGKFKTPSLRGIMNSKPWMHNGVFGDMSGLLNFYNAGGVQIKKDKNDPMSPVTSNLLKPLLLSAEELDALEAFMHAITAYPAVGPSGEFLKR